MNTTSPDRDAMHGRFTTMSTDTSAIVHVGCHDGDALVSADPFTAAELRGIEKLGRLIENDVREPGRVVDYAPWIRVLRPGDDDWGSTRRRVLGIDYY